MANKSDSKALDRLVESLRTAHGDNLASIILYGSAAAGDDVERTSDHNLLVALNRISADDLRVSHHALRDWNKLGEPMPVYFTVEELKRAADVFPIEFMQMERARKVLFGRDAFEFLFISPANLRHQTEYELRTKLLQLRRLYIPASVSVEKLLALMTDSLASFAALFRAVLSLNGQQAPMTTAETVHATVSLFELEAFPFDEILKLRTKTTSRMSDEEATEVFSAYMAQIERVIQAVDKTDS